jgi:hypothetical protein
VKSSLNKINFEQNISTFRGKALCHGTGQYVIDQLEKTGISKSGIYLDSILFQVSCRCRP